MAEDVDIPKFGKVPKKVLIPVGLGAAAYVGWRYWQARGGTGDDATTVEDGEFGAVDSSIPGVLNPFPSGSPAVGGTGPDGDTELGPGRFTNNAQWSNYVLDKLSASEWPYAEIATALGLGLAGKPTNDAQQTILRAAIAVGGQPPQGSITIVSGGNTNLTVAPTGLRVATVTEKSVALTWNSVSGADHYVVEWPGARRTTSGTSYTATGLTAGTSYTFAVSGANGADVSGPVTTIAAKTAAIQPSGYRGYGWYKANGRETGAAIAKKYYKSEFGTQTAWLQQFYKMNPGVPNTPAKGTWIKIRENSNPLTGYKGK